jgi:hypothetical protein
MVIPSASLAYYASSNISGLDFHRVDWVLRYLAIEEAMNIEACLIVRHYTSDGGYTFNQTTVITNKFDDNTQYFAELAVKF